MRTTPWKSAAAPLLAALSLLSAGPAGIAADEHAVLTAVFAKTDKGYKRQKGPDGKWVREYYAMSNGGPVEGTVKDNAQERVKFVSIATVLAEQLARQGYFPATDPEKVDLLIVVHWGRTSPFSDSLYRSGSDGVLAAMNSLSAMGQAASAQPPPNPTDAASAPQAEVTATGSVQDMQRQAAQSQLASAMLTQELFNRARNDANAKNATLLGYMGDINKADGIQRAAGGGRRYEELVADIEEARYYIILSAYDFKRTVRDKKPKLQWVTRMSMRAPGNSFAEQAAAMIAHSASRFGQNTDGLERKVTPQYKVNLEDLKFLGVAEPPPAVREKSGEE
jgi:hypothetical protein